MASVDEPPNTPEADAPRLAYGKRVFAINQRAIRIDDTVPYWDVAVITELDWRVSTDTWCAIAGSGPAMDAMYGVLKRGLPSGQHQLPADDGPLADAVKLDGRWRELMQARRNTDSS